MAALDGIEIWPLLSFVIFLVFFVLLAVRVLIMRKKHVEYLSNLPLKAWFILPALGLSTLSATAQETAAAITETTETTVGEHFGMSDDLWGILLMTSALLLTFMILGANSILKNIVAIRMKEAGKLKSVGLPIIASVIVLSDSVFWGLIATNLFFIGYLLLILRNIRIFSEDLNPKKEVASNVEAAPAKETAWSRIWKKLNAHVDIEEEQDVMTDHAYDGIYELDNRLPPWWLWGFYISIVFAVIYVFNYHILGYTPLQEEEYENEMVMAQAEVEAYLISKALNVDESTVEYLPNEERLSSGKKIYDAVCVVCHAADGGGGVGPNLTDDYYLHGCEIGDIFKTIKYGVPAKGMRAWNTDYSPVEIQNVATYIKSLQGTTPLSPKDPQGVKAE